MILILFKHYLANRAKSRSFESGSRNRKVLHKLDGLDNLLILHDDFVHVGGVFLCFVAVAGQ